VCDRAQRAAGTLTTFGAWAVSPEGSRRERRGVQMTDESDRAQRGPEAVHSGKCATANADGIEHQIDHERITGRADEIYESRSRADRHADDEWVQSAFEYEVDVSANQRLSNATVPAARSATGFEVLTGDALPAPSAPGGCPRCGAFCGTPNLLTSMTRYYICGGCGCRWQLSRIAE
jgi:hypothetical protein